MSKPKSKKAQALRYELSRCLLLKDEDRKFWTANADLLPDEVLNQLLRLVHAKNLQMQDYIIRAIKDDPSILTELKSKMAKIKKDTLKLAEVEQAPAAEQILQKELKKIK